MPSGGCTGGAQRRTRRPLLVVHKQRRKLAPYSNSSSLLFNPQPCRPPWKVVGCVPASSSSSRWLLLAKPQQLSRLSAAAQQPPLPPLGSHAWPPSPHSSCAARPPARTRVRHAWRGRARRGRQTQLAVRAHACMRGMQSRRWLLHLLLHLPRRRSRRSCQHQHHRGRRRRRPRSRATQARAAPATRRGRQPRRAAAGAAR